jgi:hypothetical protein
MRPRKAGTAASPGTGEGDRQRLDRLGRQIGRHATESVITRQGRLATVNPTRGSRAAVVRAELTRSRMLPATYILAGGDPSNGAQDFIWLIFRLEMTATAPATRWLHRNRGAPT